MAIMVWITALSLAGAAFAARLHEDLTSKGRLVDDSVDCSLRDPVPWPGPFSEGVFGNPKVESWVSQPRWRIMYVPDHVIHPKDCELYFDYLPVVGAFVRPEMRIQKDTEGKIHSFCEVATWRGGRWDPPALCRVDEGDTTWKKAEEIADEHCVYLLCHLSTTGSWKKLWFFRRQAALKRALQMPWKRELQKQGHKSYGVEDAYKKCWHGPGLLPDFDDFARRHRLMQDGNETYFNKTVCKCRTANDCT
ncbi:unnamed protein product [Cladocopium goreaui]|uniref:Uncharacterized protein n=1 Tax=Cladocopium goreaui TaxID=2562237 RepID=A0A9P1FVU7_9DINO|nr:unnamed protein product [Cladocopium goreaui]